MIITSGIVRAVEGPSKRAMVSVTKPSVSAIILLSGVKVSQLYQVNLGGGGAHRCQGPFKAIQAFISFLISTSIHTINVLFITFLRNMT